MWPYIIIIMTSRHLYSRSNMQHPTSSRVSQSASQADGNTGQPVDHASLRACFFQVSGRQSTYLPSLCSLRFWLSYREPNTDPAMSHSDAWACVKHMVRPCWTGSIATLSSAAGWMPSVFVFLFFGETPTHGPPCIPRQTLT